MDFFYRTKRTLTGSERTIRIKGWAVSKPSLVKALVTAGVTALLPVVIKLIVLAGPQLLTVLQH